MVLVLKFPILFLALLAAIICALTTSAHLGCCPLTNYTCRHALHRNALILMTFRPMINNVSLYIGGSATYRIVHALHKKGFDLYRKQSWFESNKHRNQGEDLHRNSSFQSCETQQQAVRNHCCQPFQADRNHHSMYSCVCGRRAGLNPQCLRQPIILMMYSAL